MPAQGELLLVSLPPVQSCFAGTKVFLMSNLSLPSLMRIQNRWLPRRRTSAVSLHVA